MKRTLILVAICGTLFGGSAFAGAQVGGLSSPDCVPISFKETQNPDGSYRQTEVRQCEDGAVGFCTRTRRGSKVTPWVCGEI